MRLVAGDISFVFFFFLFFLFFLFEKKGTAAQFSQAAEKIDSSARGKREFIPDDELDMET